METIEVQVRRLSVVSDKPFEEIVKTFTATIGRPDATSFHKSVATAKTLDELEGVVHAAVGSSNLMEFARFDVGDVLREESGARARRSLRLVVGKPLIMKEMVKTVPDAASYAPVTVLIDERADGVHLSYDSMASLISPYGSEAALAIARDLDAKVESLLETTAH